MRLEQMIDDELQRRADIEFEDEYRDCDCCGERFDVDDLNIIVGKFGNEKHFCDECNVPF